jgi:CRP-like cAMP-binding protein
MTIENDVALLERVPTFRMLGREALRVLAIGAESRTLNEREVLFREGEPADCGYVVEEGLLSATVRGGGEPVLLSRGVLLGEVSLITETRRPATVAAVEPSSVMRIPRALFLRMLQGYPDIAERLREAFAERAERMARELAHVRYALDLGDPPLDLAAPGQRKE